MGAAAPVGHAAAWAKCFAEHAKAEDGGTTDELQALVPILAGLPAHERGGSVVNLFRRSLKDLDLGFALGSWRLLNKAKQSSTWHEPLSTCELHGLLAALRCAKSLALREVLLELVEQSPCPAPLRPLALLWAQPAWPVTEWRLHRVAMRRLKRADRWREAKESAYFQLRKVPLVDPRAVALRGLRLAQLQELLRGHARYLQEPAFNEQLRCYLRPSSWEFYLKVLKPASIEGRSFAELYLPQEVQLVVSHCWCSAFEDLVLTLERYELQQSTGLVTGAPVDSCGYWSSLLSCGREAPEHLAAAVETARQLVIVWDEDGRWSTRQWCLYELSIAHRRQKMIQVATLSGVLGPALAKQSRQVAVRLISSDPRFATLEEEIREPDVKHLREEIGDEAMDQALLAAAGPLLCCTPNFQQIQDLALDTSETCWIIEGCPGHRTAQLAQTLQHRLAGLPLQISCEQLGKVMEAKQLTGDHDLLKHWFDSVDVSLEPVVAKYGKLLIFLEALHEAGRHSAAIVSWAQRCLEQKDIKMIITTAGEEQKWTRKQLAQMDVVTCDMVHLSQCDPVVQPVELGALLETSCVRRLRIRMEEDGCLWLEGLSADPRCIGRHEYLDLVAATGGGRCFEVYDTLVSQWLPGPLDLKLSEAALRQLEAGEIAAPWLVASHLPRLPLPWSPALRSFCAAKALLLRNDLAPQVLSQQWPQVRHFLRRALELELRRLSSAELPVLQQKLKMARVLNADATVLAPLLKAPDTEAAAAEALDAWLAMALEEQLDEALPQLLSLASGVPSLDARNLEMARAKVRVQELLELGDELSLPELLVTLEAAAVLPAEAKWPLAKRFLEKIKGRISNLDQLKLLIRLLKAAPDVPSSCLQEPLQEFLAASLPCHLVAALHLLPKCCQTLRDGCQMHLERWCSGTLPQRRIAGGRYHSLLLQGGRAIAIGLNGQGESSVPPLPEDVRYVAVAAGAQHSLLLRSDGVVKAMGLNLDGQAQVPSTLTQPIVAVAAGGFHSVVLDHAGHCWAFGCNAQHQCDVPRDHDGAWRFVTCGQHHTLCLRADGMAFACGANADGQCDVPDLFWDAGATHPLKYITGSAGARHTVLLRNDGKAVAFGSNFYGQCDVPPRGERYAAVACGDHHSLLLRLDGQVLALGDDGYGQCQIPTLPPTLRYLAIAAGARHSLLLRSDGRVLALGDDGEGQCGIPLGLHFDDS